MFHNIFSSKNLLVKAALFEGSKTLFVTFDHATKTPSMRRSGFGERFFLKRRISAIHFIPAKSDWYQFEEMIQACEAVREIASPFAVRIGYGSSMGGYAALNFAPLINLNRVLAISPQYSFDSRKIPSDPRYRAAHNKINGVVWDRIDSQSLASLESLILYDRKDPMDKYHVDLIKACSSVETLALDHSGHPVTNTLSTDSLKSILLSIADPDHGLEQVIATATKLYRMDRNNGWHYFANLSRRSYRASVGRRISLAKKAVTLSDWHKDPLILLSNLCLMGNDAVEALVYYGQGFMLYPNDSSFLYGYLKALKKLGRLDACEKLVRMKLEEVQIERERSFLVRLVE